MTRDVYAGEDAGTFAWRVRQLEVQVRDLNRKVDRLTWALTLAAVSFAGATAMLMVTLLTGAHN